MRAAQIPDEKYRTRHSLLKLLLQYGANVNTVDTQGRHVLSWACIHEKEDIVRQLCSSTIQDIDLNLKDLEGNTPLMHAARAGNPTILKMLLDKLTKFQVDIDVRNHEDRTPYLEARRLGNEKCAEILLKEGKASTDIQVNPFLDFINEKDGAPWKGEIRSTEESKYRAHDSTREKILTPHYAHKKSQKRKTRHVSKKKSALAQENEEVIKSKSPTSGTRKHLNANFALERKKKSCKRPPQTRKCAWSETAVTGLVTSREFVIEKESSYTTTTEIPENYSLQTESLSSCDEGTKESKLKTTAQSSNFRQGLTQTGKRASEKLTAKLNLNFDSSEGRITRNNFRSLSRSSLTSEVPMDDILSWHSHFSIYNSTSVAFLSKLMSIYAEQVSPASSFRVGVTTVKTVPKLSSPKIFVAETQNDDRSDGSRLGSAAGNRSITPSRKFSEATRTVVSLLSTQRALASLKAE